MSKSEGAQGATNVPDSNQTGNGEPSFFKEWTTLVEAAGDDWLKDIARWRGIDPHYFQWLTKHKLFGRYNGQPAFPVIYNGVVVAIHYRVEPRDSDQKAQWFYKPKLSQDLGIGMQPFIIGDLALAAKVHAFESPWDQCAIDYGLDYLHNSDKLVTLSTRGAANAKLLAVIPPSVKEIVLWPQNDEAGRNWEADALKVLQGRKVTIGRTPLEYKDVGEWVQAGAQKEDLFEAMKPVQRPNEDPQGRIGRSAGRAGVPENSEESQEQKLFAELSDKYQSALINFGEFRSLDIKPRECLIGKWMKEGDTGFVFGQRGKGKTWLIHILSSHLSSGQDIDEEWDIPQKEPVVLVDGEMPWDDTMKRLAGLNADSKSLYLLHHEVLFERTGLDMNLADPEVQQIVTGLCERVKAKLLVLETLSSLFRGVSENDSDAWEKILHWLLDLRRRRIAVLITLHAGWNGDHARGSSRREDDVFFVIKVAEITDREPEEKGAKFETEFTKWRNLDAPPPTRHWHVVTEADGTVSYNCAELTFDAKVLDKIKAGLRSASDLAEELKVAKSMISRAADRLEKLKLIERIGKGNRITYEPRGFMRK